MPTISISSPHLDHATLHRTGDDGAATGDGEDVFHRHQEGTVDRTLGRGNVGVQRLGQLHDGFFAQLSLVAFQRELGRAVDDGGVVARELVLVEQFSNLHLDEFEQLGVVHHVALVQEHDDVADADLTRQQDVLAGLRHGAVGSRAHQNGAVHLGGTGNHVFHVVGVAGAVDVRVVAVGSLVLDVGGVDGDAARLLFGSRIDLVVALGFAAELGRQHRGDGRRQRGLAVVNVTNRAHVHVRLRAGEFSFCHFLSFKEQARVRFNVCTPVAESLATGNERHKIADKNQQLSRTWCSLRKVPQIRRNRPAGTAPNCKQGSRSDTQRAQPGRSLFCA